MWLTQPQHLRYRDAGPIVAIVICVKITYFVDREISLNFETNQQLVYIKEFVTQQPLITTFIPLIAVFFVESKMNRLYRFGKTH